jgi:hypothetical protein
LLFIEVVGTRCLSFQPGSSAIATPRRKRTQAAADGQSVTCDGFKRLPNGTWVTVKDVSINYERHFGDRQLNYGKGWIITGTGDSEGARLLKALNKVCG